MKTGQFQTYIITLMLVFAFCGTRVVVWDYSDYHDVKKATIDQADSHGNDMDDVKNKQLVHPPPLLTKSFDLSLPALVDTSLNPTDVQRTNFLSNITPSFPSRASPA